MKVKKTAQESEKNPFLRRGWGYRTGFYSWNEQVIPEDPLLKYIDIIPVDKANVSNFGWCYVDFGKVEYTRSLFVIVTD